MEAGRIRNQDSKMKGTINQDNKLTDIYLPRKCDYTDRIITSKDHSSIQLSVADVLSLSSRSMKTAPSTSARPALLPSQDSSGPPERVTPLSTRYSGKENSSDRTLDIFHMINTINQGLKHHTCLDDTTLLIQ